MLTMIEAAVPWLADALVIAGLLIMTLAVYGMVRMPDIYLRVHAAGKAVFLGVCLVLFASMLTGDPAIFARAVLVIAFLLITTPVASHTIARAAFLRGEPMYPGHLDESGRGLTAPQRQQIRRDMPQDE